MRVDDELIKQSSERPTLFATQRGTQQLLAGSDKRVGACEALAQLVQQRVADDTRTSSLRRCASRRQLIVRVEAVRVETHRGRAFDLKSDCSAPFRSTFRSLPLHALAAGCAAAQAEQRRRSTSRALPRAALASCFVRLPKVAGTQKSARAQDSQMQA